uniref:Uncharacterized protein n=1 Tax=Leptobrachium leishanense TaxID=445787 RepID=A0A8C5Q3T1_9ANUR
MSGRSGRGRKGRGTSQKRKAEPVEEIDVKIEPEDQSDVCPETPTSLVKTEVESRWEWQGDGGTWVVFSPQLNTLISQAFSSGKRSVTVHPAEGISLQVDFTKMMQKNTQSGFQRPVRLAVQNEDQFFVWQWQTDDHSWIPYDAETSVTLETALQSEDKLVTVNLRGLQYTMDLGNMVQKNTQTQYERQIQRSLSVADDYVEPQSQNISNGPSVKRPRKSAVSMDNEEEESKGGIMGHQASAPSTAMTCVVRSVSVPNSPVLDVELLISAVEQYPALWDTADNDYKEKNKKSYAWIQVSKRLFEDFETHSEEQQKLIIQDVMSKWRTVRDNYVRNLKKRGELSKSGLGAKKVRLYIYGEQLSFLKKCLEPRAQTSSIDSEPDPFEQSQDYDGNGGEAEHESEVHIETVIPMDKPAPSRKKKSTDVELALLEFMQAHKPQRSIIEDDDDLAFFYSLLPTVKSLTADEKFTFRLQTMQLLQNIKQAEEFHPNLLTYHDNLS